MAPDELTGRLFAASGLIDQGRMHAATGELHDLVQSIGEPKSYDEATALFVAHRLLGQCERTGGDIERARSHYLTCVALAQALDSSALLSAAFEGLARVAMAEARPQEVETHFTQAARQAKLAGDQAGHMAVLTNYAEYLHYRDDDRAEGLFRQVLASPATIPLGRGICLDNLGLELRRQGRTADAAECHRQAAAIFEQEAAERHLFIALFRLTEVLRILGDGNGASAAFRRAHDVVHRLYSEIDERHYTEEYTENIRGLEAVAKKRFDGLPLANAFSRFDQMVAWVRGEGDEAEMLMYAGRLAAAQEKLLTVQAFLESIGATHMLLEIWNKLGSIHTDVGHYDKAREILLRSRDAAREIGDAQQEQHSLINLIRLASRVPEYFEFNILELAAQARPLIDFRKAQYIAEITQMGFAPAAEIAGLPDWATSADLVDAAIGAACLDNGAPELAERYLSRSVAAAELSIHATEHAPSGMLAHAKSMRAMASIRIALRLCRLIEVYWHTGDVTAAADVRARLETLIQDGGEPQLRLIVRATLGRRDFAGQWDAELLAALTAACSAYEEQRGLALDIGELAEYRGVSQPPYLEAVEVALYLGRVAEAFDLLERSKCRSLLDSLRGLPAGQRGDNPRRAQEDALWRRLRDLRAELAAPAADTSGQEHEARPVRMLRLTEELTAVRGQLAEIWEELPDLRSHRLAEPITLAEVQRLLAQRGSGQLTELFVGTKAVHALFIDSVSAGTRSLLTVDDPQWEEFVTLAIPPPSREVSIGGLLEHPVFRLLHEQVVADRRSAADGPHYLVPHRALHTVPFQLAPLAVPDSGARGSAPVIQLPSAALLRARSPRAPGGRTIAAGDPTGSLPYAAAEALSVAASFGTHAAIGAQVTYEWLADALGSDGPVRLIHLACHATFDPYLPERSGLVLAAAPRQEDINASVPSEVIAIPQLAQLDWSASLVVLSACASGRHGVLSGDELAGLGRTILGCGAQMLVVSLQPVPDLSTAVLMDHFYAGLGRTGDWPAARIAAALVHAQRTVADLTAKQLTSWAAGHYGLPGQAVLACAAQAAAHGAAGNFDAQADWQARAMEARGNPATCPAPDTWATQLRVASQPRYSARPFADPRHWASFMALGS